MTTRELKSRVRELENELGEARSVIRHADRVLQQYGDIKTEPLQKRMDRVLAS